MYKTVRNQNTVTKHKNQTARGRPPEGRRRRFSPTSNLDFHIFPKLSFSFTVVVKFSLRRRRPSGGRPRVVCFLRLFAVFFPVYIYLNDSFILLFCSAYSVQFLVPTTTSVTSYLFVGAGPT